MCTGSSTGWEDYCMRKEGPKCPAVGRGKIEGVWKGLSKAVPRRFRSHPVENIANGSDDERNLIRKAESGKVKLGSIERR
jgi:hypothetical protein